MRTDTETAAVRVKAPARLHLGFVDLNGSLGRRYGSLGLAVDAPATELSLAPAAEFTAHGAESERALKLMQRLAQSLEVRRRYRADVSAAIPAHAGLGSGTQLALAIGTALIRLEGLTVTARQLGELVERGARSAIGMAAFESGGFIVDGGRGRDGHSPPVVAQTGFPEAWRVMLVLDPAATGVHGDRETAAFAALPPFTDAMAGHLSRLTLMQLLPALHEENLSAFGAAVTEIQEIVGGHFSAAQGGSNWSSPAVGRLIGRLGDAGAVGIGQSSWGPTGFGFMESETAAARLYSTFVEEATAQGLELLVVRGRNSGGRIEVIPSADAGCRTPTPRSE
ncbi:MAG: beta-ribofuranosylaminobenzene 5'-phosphate synthase family protein [Hyphomicrobium sp.]